MGMITGAKKEASPEEDIDFDLGGSSNDKIKSITIDSEFSFCNDGSCWVLLQKIKVTKPSPITKVFNPDSYRIKKRFYSRLDHLLESLLDIAPDTSEIDSIGDLRKFLSGLTSRIEKAVQNNYKPKPAMVVRLPKGDSSAATAKKNFPSWKREAD